MDENTDPTRTGGESTGTRLGSVGRRDYLRTIGGAGALGLLGAGASGTVLAQTSDWEAPADDRIQQHRTGGLEVVVQDTNGQPVSDAQVSVEMQEHDYGFGNALSADLLVNETEPGHPYRESLKEDFNVVWFGNYHKWRFFEENQDVSDRATAWAKDNGLDIRGHVCLWANVSAWSVPGDVVDAMGVDHESGESGANLDPEHVRTRAFDHVQDIIQHYADFEYDGESYGSVIEEWEVMNEVVHEPGLIRAVNGVAADQESSDLDPVTEPVLAEWYNHARDAAPDDVGLAVNDYNTMEGSWEYARSDYERQIEFLAANGNLDYAGIQSHFGSRDTAVSPEEALDVLDRYAQHGVRLRVTEYDATGDDWSDQEKGDFFHDYLKTVFSHEATDAFLIAGGSDAHHWREDAPFFYDDWSPKPAYQVYQDLVFDEWWTSESGTTDGSGVYPTNAFLGEHEVTVSTSAGSTTQTVSVTDSNAIQQVTVTVQSDGGGDSCPEGTDAPAQVNGVYPHDLDGDGLHEDLNGNCRLDNDDVVTYFEEMDSSGITNNVGNYDYNGNGRIDFDDLVTLFEGL